MPLRVSDAVPEEEDAHEGKAESVVAEESAPSVEIRAEHHSAELHFYAHGSTAEAIEALERIDALDPSGMAVRLLESMLEDSVHRRESARTEARRRHALDIRHTLRLVASGSAGGESRIGRRLTVRALVECSIQRGRDDTDVIPSGRWR